MSKTLNRILYPAALAALVSLAGTLATLAQAGSLENLERERAAMIAAGLDPLLSPDQRAARLESALRRLADLERMVLRDDGLIGRNTPHVRRAFANSDLTFLVHAAAEQDSAVMDLWLEQVGVSTDSLLAARAGRR